MTGAGDAGAMDAFEELMAELARSSGSVHRTKARKKRTESAEAGILPCGDLTCPCRVRTGEKVSGSRYRGR